MLPADQPESSDPFPALEACRNGLQAVLEEWIVDQLYLYHQLPSTIDGFTLDPDRIDEQEIAEAHAALEEDVVAQISADLP